MAKETESSGDDPNDGKDPPSKDKDATENGKGNKQLSQKNTGSNSEDGFEHIKAHHKDILALVKECADLKDKDESSDIIRRLSKEWRQHAVAHRALFDMGCEAGLEDNPLLAQAIIRTEIASLLLDEAQWELEEPLARAALQISAQNIKKVIECEEKPTSGLLAQAKAAGVDPVALGRRIRACLNRPSDKEDGRMPPPRYLSTTEEEPMPRYRNMPDRDERGRFVSDDDHSNRSHRGSYRDDDRSYSRSRYEDDDRDYRSRASRRDDDRRYGSSSRYEDDDRGYSRDRGQGGWFGDPEGHSEASRRGWDHRRDEDDDDRYYSRSSRSSHRDDDRRYGSSSRYEDDDRGYSRDRGQGGWFGDPEGHSEASRRGWDHRRDDDDYGRRSSSRGRR